MNLRIKNLFVNIEGKEIVKGLNLEIKEGEIAALMGPNGSGKSTIANVIMGNPKYEVAKGEIIYKGKNILDLKVYERAKLGLFLSFQYPVEIPGVSLINFLRTAYNSIHGELSVIAFKKLLEEKMELLRMDKSFMDRYLNEGFSGGEKKRAEILQLAILNPSIAVIDEVDSGADVDSLKVFANGINTINKENNSGILLITHYNRILKYIKPNKVYVMINGKIVDSGNYKLAEEIEKKGYEKYL